MIKRIGSLLKNRFLVTLVSILVTLLVGLGYFYVALPALNFHSGDLYQFLFILCLVYFGCVFLLSGGAHMQDDVVRTPTEKFKLWFAFIKSRCLPVLLVFIAVLLVAIIGTILSWPIFRAGAYRQLLSVEAGDFTADVAQISFDKIPTLDRTSAEYLGDRQMGTLSDMVSQFEYSNDSTQINYQGRPVRVAPVDYADLIKWLTNRGEGLPAYVLVDMVTQQATVVRLPEGMKYSFSEPLNRNIERHLRFHYPTMMFSTPEFEIDEDGHPWWIAPRVVKTIGLFGGTDIRGAVLVDAVTGECEYMEQVPTWVDTLYTPTLIMEQYDYYGTYVRGFFNSIFGQRDVTITTDGYNYIAMNDDVYMYTGVTSANADQSNLGFLLCNMRTKQTKYYVAPGATEEAAKLSAMGVVQDLGYTATFPLLLNVAGEPTYFIPLKDATQLVKMYAMVNVAQYQVVATGTTVSACEQAYIRMLGDKGLSQPEQLPATQTKGTVAEIRTAVLEGTSYYFVRLEGSEIFYSVSAAQNRDVIALNVGDEVTIDHAQITDAMTGYILDAYSLTAAPRTTLPLSPLQGSYNSLDGTPVASGTGLPFSFQQKN